MFITGGIDNYAGSIVTKTALQLSALFFCRPVDIRSLKWSDINREENRIEIQASKTYLYFIVLLSSQAKTSLDKLERLDAKLLLLTQQKWKVKSIATTTTLILILEGIKNNHPRTRQAVPTIARLVCKNH